MGKAAGDALVATTAAFGTTFTDVVLRRPNIPNEGSLGRPARSATVYLVCQLETARSKDRADAQRRAISKSQHACLSGLPYGYGR